MTGKTLGHYRVVEKIGAGGMGEVYRARDTHLDRDAAVKVLPPGLLGDEPSRKRFRREAEALSKLNHPHIAIVYDFDSLEGMDYLVMEFVDGPTLAGKLHAGPLRERQACELGEQIASALEEAHEHGIIHRDLKPRNIIVTPKGQAKVLDFGLARLLRPVSEDAPTASLTLADHGAGTLPYMAPEQLRGETADARTDIHALGAVLYEMATGRRPFDAKLPTALAADIQTRPPQPPCAVNVRLSAELERIILKCLEKEPANRYQSAKELAVDLRRLRTPSAGIVAPALQARAKSPRMVLAIAGAVVAVAALVGLLAFDVPGLRSWLFGSPTTVPQIESIAVLPLKNLMNDPEQDYFVEGMHEELIGALSKISALKVISRASTLRYKETAKSVPEIARELNNVDGIVTGSVMRDGNKVRISVQLIHAGADRQLWSQSFDRELRDILGLYSDVARAIANQVRATLTPQDQAQLARAKAPVDPEVYGAYLKGQRYFWIRNSFGDLQKAVQLFRRALEIDPSYAPAHAGLAVAYSERAWYQKSALDLRKDQGRAEESALAALRLDDTVADAYAVLASIRVENWDWAGAEDYLKRALELDPTSVLTHTQGVQQSLSLRRFEEALRRCSDYGELHPFSPANLNWCGMASYSVGDYDGALSQWKASTELVPNFWAAHGCQGFGFLQKGMNEEALSAARRAEELALVQPHFEGLAYAGHLYGRLGMKDDAFRMLRKVRARSEDETAGAAVWTAIIYAGLGDKDRAFEWLERAFQQRSAHLGIVQFVPGLGPLRSDPRYKDMVRRMNFPQ